MCSIIDKNNLNVLNSNQIMEQETVTLKVIERTHNKITLETASGNTFTFDPTKRLAIHGEDFYDFLFY
jgi:hypothetical protein